MIRFIYPNKSCTLYSEYSLLNTGADEILELTSEVKKTGEITISRILMQFTDDDIKSNYSLDTKFFLNLKIIQNFELEFNSEIEFFPVGESWEEGKGRFADSEVLYPGASWERRNGVDEWKSNQPAEYDTGGGTWYTSYSDENEIKHPINLKYKFNKNISDVRIDFTPLVSWWVNNQIENNGFIIKFKNDETNRIGNIKFFSEKTNTVYRPYIEVSQRDYIFNPFTIENNSVETLMDSGSLDSGSLDSGSLDSGSLDSGSLDSGSLDSGSLDSGSLDSGSLDSGSLDTISSDIQTGKLPENLTELNTTDLLLFVVNAQKTYSKSTVDRINVGVRERYPRKKFQKKMRYSYNNITSKNIFYSVIDAETEEIIIDFSEYTQVSCDTDGHYFMFDFDCLSRGRMYKFILKLKDYMVDKKYEDTLSFMITN